MSNSSETYTGNVYPTDRKTFPTQSWEEPTDARTRTEETLGGTTSAEVYSGPGVRPSSMSSQEYHHDGQIHRKRDRCSTDQYGQMRDMQKAREEAEAEKE